MDCVLSVTESGAGEPGYDQVTEFVSERKPAAVFLSLQLGRNYDGWSLLFPSEKQCIPVSWETRKLDICVLSNKGIDIHRGAQIVPNRQQFCQPGLWLMPQRRPVFCSHVRIFCTSAADAPRAAREVAFLSILETSVATSRPCFLASRISLRDSGRSTNSWYSGQVIPSQSCSSSVLIEECHASTSWSML